MWCTPLFLLGGNKANQLEHLPMKQNAPDDRVAVAFRLMKTFTHRPVHMMHTEDRQPNVHAPVAWNAKHLFPQSQRFTAEQSPKSLPPHSTLRREVAVVNVCPWGLEMFSEETAQTGIPMFISGATPTQLEKNQCFHFVFFLNRTEHKLM